MSTLPLRIKKGEVDAPDVLCGGTPCQAFSLAGKRESLDDARGNLSLVFCEIANEIDAVRHVRRLPPVTILWENVPGVLSTHDNAFGCFLAELAGESEPLEPAPRPAEGKSNNAWRWIKASNSHTPSWPNAGYVVGPKRALAWRVFDAQYHGLAQRRKRVFVVASAREGFDPAAVLFEFDGMQRNTAPSREAGEGVARIIGSCASPSRGVGVHPEVSAGFESFGCEFGPSGGRFTDVNPTLDARAKDGPIRNQLAGCVATLCVATGQAGAEIGVDVAPTLNCNHEAPYVTLSGVESVASRHVAGALTSSYGKQPDSSDSGLGPNLVIESRSPIAFQSVGHCADATTNLLPTLRAFDPMAVCFDTTNITSPENQSNPKNGDPCHTLASGAHPPAIAFQERGRAGGPNIEIGGEVAFALTAPAGGGRAQERNSLTPAMQVRRLTPRECERLQGFQFRVAQDYPGAWQDAPGEWWSPDYTLIPGRLKKINPAKLDSDYIKYLARGGLKSFDECCNTAADGPRYKALGNSWAVPNVNWIGRRIDAAMFRLNAANDAVMAANEPVIKGGA
jgi:DNA (cytosine-5)-methyltransferase 1